MQDININHNEQNCSSMIVKKDYIHACGFNLSWKCYEATPNNQKAKHNFSLITFFILIHLLTHEGH